LGIEVGDMDILDYDVLNARYQTEPLPLDDSLVANPDDRLV
jgi:hypothetical protein